MYSNIYFECVRLWKIFSIEANALPYSVSDNDSEISTGIHNIRMYTIPNAFFSSFFCVCFRWFRIFVGSVFSVSIDREWRIQRFRLCNLNSLYLICFGIERFYFDTNRVLHTYYKQRFYILWILYIVCNSTTMILYRWIGYIDVYYNLTIAIAHVKNSVSFQIGSSIFIECLFLYRQ